MISIWPFYREACFMARLGTQRICLESWVCCHSSLVKALQGGCLSDTESSRRMPTRCLLPLSTARGQWKEEESVARLFGYGCHVLSVLKRLDNYWIPDSALGSTGKKMNSEGVIYLSWKRQFVTSLSEASSEYCPMSFPVYQAIYHLWPKCYTLLRWGKTQS